VLHCVGYKGRSPTHRSISGSLITFYQTPAARLFPQGLSRELPRQRACVTEMQLYRVYRIQHALIDLVIKVKDQGHAFACVSIWMLIGFSSSSS